MQSVPVGWILLWICLTTRPDDRAASSRTHKLCCFASFMIISMFTRFLAILSSAKGNETCLLSDNIQLYYIICYYFFFVNQQKHIRRVSSAAVRQDRRLLALALSKIPSCREFGHSDRLSNCDTTGDAVARRPEMPPGYNSFCLPPSLTGSFSTCDGDGGSSSTGYQPDPSCDPSGLP